MAPRFKPLTYTLYLCALISLSYTLIILLYAFLPSPPPFISSSLGNITTTEAAFLQGTAPLTRVYPVSKFYSYLDTYTFAPIAAVFEEGREYFALTYTLHYNAHEKETWLGIGREQDDVTLSDVGQGWESLNLTEYVTIAKESGGEVYLSESVNARAKFGDTDGFNLPWFTEADAMLLFWEIHWNSGHVPVRVRVLQGERVEIWADASYWREVGDDDGRRQATPPGSTPLLTLSDPDGFNGISHPTLIRAEGEEDWISTPSRTFPLRKALHNFLVWTYAAILLPVWEGTYFLRFLLFWLLMLAFWIFYAALVYAIVVFGVWIYAGRPAFGPWAQQYVLTRWLVKKIGEVREHPTGSVQSGVGSIVEAVTGIGKGGKRDPMPLRSVFHFFTSESPLDDLLVTFAATRYLAEPLFSSGGEVQSGKVGGRAGVATESESDSLEERGKVIRTALGKVGARAGDVDVDIEKGEVD